MTKILKIQEYCFDPETDLRTRQGPYLITPIIWFRLIPKIYDATLISYLWNKREIYKLKKQLAPGGWFYCTNADIQDRLGLNRVIQNTCFGRLERLGFVDRKYKKIPKQKSKFSVRWVRVNRKTILAAVRTKFQDMQEFEALLAS